MPILTAFLASKRKLPSQSLNFDSKIFIFELLVFFLALIYTFSFRMSIYFFIFDLITQILKLILSFCSVLN